MFEMLSLMGIALDVFFIFFLLLHLPGQDYGTRDGDFSNYRHRGIHVC